MKECLCPICNGRARSARSANGDRTIGSLWILDATCRSCGWHFTTATARAQRDREAASVDAELASARR